MANGIFAQSVGGGGGDAGGAYSGSPIGLSTSVGGNGSGGGNGGGVSVGNSGVIETDGRASQAIFAQSVGGGGGDGAIAGSFSIALTTPAFAVSVGGNGGGGGSGGTVDVTNHLTGSVIVNGVDSTAIFAQSVGGGGGNGGGSIGGALALGHGAARVNLGGNGGSGGDGGKVTVVNDGAIQINGMNSVGILAQSIGGGGGTAGSALGVSIVPIFLGGQNGAIGKGGDVSVTNTGSIRISGDNSIGIFAQSVGGGGGLVKPGGGASGVVLQAGGSGNGGVVTIDNSAGSIIVTGDNSIALYSQIDRGGGDAVGLAVDPPGQIGAFPFPARPVDRSGAGDGHHQTGDLIAWRQFDRADRAAQCGARQRHYRTSRTSRRRRSALSKAVAASAGIFILNGPITLSTTTVHCRLWMVWPVPRLSEPTATTRSTTLEW
jgi:hypothetical protein